MKILQKPKKSGPPHPAISSLASEILEAPVDKLPQLLGSIETWRWAKSELTTWIDVLNKFDTILEDVIREYSIDDLQVNAFSPEKKQLIRGILNFERLLFENTTNRKTFNSYDRLNSLLFSSDLDVVIDTLNLLLRPSQNYSAHPAVAFTQSISNSRLEALAKAPPSHREHGIELLDLVGNTSNECMKKLPQEVSEVNFTFYKKIVRDEATAAESGNSAADSTQQQSTHASVPHTIHLGPLAHSSRSPIDILTDSIASHQVPSTKKYELLSRIRQAHALGEDRDSERQLLVQIRLLAIAVYAHTHTETQAQSTIFLYETDIVNRLADLLRQDKGVSIEVQTASIFALDALARYEGKMAEVLGAVNAGVNHGILMSLLRKAVQDMGDPDSTLPNVFIDALISFIAYIISHSNGGNMMVGAGLIPLLIQIVGTSHEQRLPVVTRTMQLIDSVLVGYPTGLTIFCNGGGINALTGRIQHEVNTAIRSHGSEEGAQSPLVAFGLVEFTRAGILKHMLKAMHRTMQTSGTVEGMRGLIDSSLLSSVNAIIQYRGVFGTSVLPIAINIIATFVHNEPTSLTAIQEAKVPETVYDAIEAGIEPTFEVIQAITNAIGALCLNQAGQDQLAGRPCIIPALFSIFTSERHLKVLTEKENAASIGSAVNELVRHHPILKNTVFDSLLSTIRRIICLGEVYEPPDEIRKLYMLKSAKDANQQTEDVTMDESVSPQVAEPASNDSMTRREETNNTSDEQSEKSRDNLVMSYVDCLGRFLEGLLRHAPHCSDFVSSTEMLNSFSQLFTLPCLPYNYANALHSDSIVQVIRGMVEVAPIPTLTHLSEKVKESLNETIELWQGPSENSRLISFVEIESEEDLANGNACFRKLITLHNRLTLLSDVFATSGYAQNRNVAAILESNALSIIPNLGTLHRTCIWENIILKDYGAGTPTIGSTSSASLQTGPAEDAAAVSTSTADQQPEPASSTPTKVEDRRLPIWIENATTLRNVINQIPNALKPFFQAVSNMLLYKRTPDDNHKRQAFALLEDIGSVIYKHLTEYKQYVGRTSDSYHTLMLGLVTVMLFDERSNQNSYHAVLLYTFRKLGGLAAIFDICRGYIDTISRISATNQSDRSDKDKEELARIYGGLKMSLHLLLSLISFKPSIDPMTQFISQGKEETDPEYYEPHDSLVRIRLSVAPIVIEIWRSPWLTSAPPSVSKYVVHCVQAIVSGSNEVPSPNAALSSEFMPSSAQGLLRLSAPPSEDRIRQLIDMGFQRGAAMLALQRTNNNVNFATEYLLSHPYETGPENAGERNAEDNVENDADNDEEHNAENSAENNAENSAENSVENSSENGVENDVENTMEVGVENSMENDEDNEGSAVNQVAAENGSDDTEESDDSDDNDSADDTPVPTVETADGIEGRDVMETDVTTQPPADASSRLTGETSERRRKELDELRQDVLSDIVALSLRLVDANPALIFYIKQIFMGLPSSNQKDAIRCVVEDIEKFSPTAYDVKEEPLHIRIRLLALILAETPNAIVEASVEGGNGPQNLLNVFHALLLSHPIGIDKDQPLPAWLAALFLTMESILIQAETPRQIPTVTPEQTIDEPPELFPGPSYKEVRTTVFELCMRLLEIQNIPCNELLATLRMLVLLTRNRIIADNFIRRSGVSLLMQRMKKPNPNVSVPGIHIHVAILLRHLVEDRASLVSVMRLEIKEMFSSPRSRAWEVLTYVRSSVEMASRDPQIFVEVTKELCTLVSPDVPNYQLTLRSNKAPTTATAVQETPGDDAQMQLDEPSPSTTSVSSEALEDVVHYMLNELVRVGKLASDQLRAEYALPKNSSAEKVTTTKEPTVNISQSAEEAGTHDAAEVNENNEDPHAYACFLMQSLSELLFSYEQCKLAFLSYPKRLQHTPVKDSLVRQKSFALNFLLSELVSFGAFDVEPKFDVNKRIILCNWAMSVIVALCVDHSVGQGQSELSVELSSVRKLVIESINKALKESPANEPVDARYSRTLALADLCERLLTVRLKPDTSSRAPEETPMQLAKLMLEKGFVATLTNALSDVDLNYPNMRSLVTSILRPLDYLTKVAIKMGRAYDKFKDNGIEAKSEGSSSSLSAEDEGEDEEMMVEGRGETPDLYRNSSLGMYAGELDEAYFNDGDETMDEGDEDEDDEDDVDIEYDGDAGSDNSSRTDPDEAEEEMPTDIIADGNGREWDGDEDMEEDEGDSSDDEEEEEEDGDDVDEGGDDEEILWQGNGAADLARDIVNDMEDDEDIDDIGMVDGVAQAIENDDADAFSEDQDLEEGDLVELDDVAAPADDPFGFGVRQTAQHMGLRSQFLLGGGARNRNPNPDMQIFGRPRYNTSSNNTEAMIHPLLIDHNAGISQSGQNRIHTRRSRFSGPSATHPDIVQTIEDLLGGGTYQLVQELITRGGLNPFADIDIPVGTEGILNSAPNLSARHGRATTSATPGLRDMRSSSERSDSTEFGPLPTTQRWLQEAELIQGKHATEHVQRLSNHIILALLPEAREAARIEKEREEKERAEREAAEREKAAREEAERLEKEAVEKAAAEKEALERAAEQEARENEVVPMEADEEIPAVIEEGSHSSLADTQVQQASEEVQSDAEMREAEIARVVAVRPPPGSSTEASRSLLQPERVYATVNGQRVDITETGIDPTFLEALPEDMREEVLSQQLRELRGSGGEPPVETEINADFLDALPPDIRAEVLREERLERSRRERQEQAGDEAGNVMQGGPADFDAADFIASLDPQLRQVVLLDSDEGILQTLPSHIVAEAGMYRGFRHSHSNNTRHDARQGSSDPNHNSSSRKMPLARDAIQLLDRNGLMALIRLIFFPQLSRRSNLHKVLLNLCENAKSRTELFGILIGILQEGTGDVALVDKSFSQLSFKSTKASIHGTPSKTTGKHKESTSSGLPIVPNDTPVDIIVQRCLAALSFIVSSNELSSLFFLTEHELPAGLKKHASKKGKGKEKQTAQTYYPVVLLLGLLERQSLLKTSSIMDAVTGLLDAVTRPLTSLIDQGNKQTNVEATVVGTSEPVQQETTTEANLPSESRVAEVNNAEVTPVQTSQRDRQEKDNSTGSMEEKLFLANPPQIPHPALRSIVNILTIGECSSRSFQHTLALIQHLSFLPDARNVVAMELKVKANDFGSNISRDIDDLVLALNVNAHFDLPPSVVVKFSPASSDQAKLLRVLKTIDFMYSSPASVPNATHQPEHSEHSDKAREIYEAFRFTSLWQKLSDCLTVVEQRTEIESVATILLPLIESLLVVCKNVGVKTPPSYPGAPGSPRSPHPTEQSIDELFVTFTDNHRKILNLMVRNNPSLMSGSFSLLVQNPRVLDFDNKRNYFSQQLHKRPHPRDHYGSMHLHIRRARVFEDSFHAFQHKTGDQIKYGKLSVRFNGEEGVDAGGLTREWFQILARQMFDPNYALFEPCAADRQTYQPNRASAINPDHLSYFKFVGRVIGKAIYDGRLMDAHFARSLYRQLLGKPVDYRDVEWVDPEYYKSLCWILENDPTMLDLTFITEVDEFGKHAVIELKENGAATLVTLDNRKEYVQLSAQYRLFSSIKEQIEHLLSGFYEIVPKDLISIFNEQEVELLISGTPDIDVDEWRAATEYIGYTGSDPVIVWWWRALKSFNRDERAKLLSFATGTSRVPLGGFVELQGVQGNQRFSIHKAYGQPDRLPQAHTCFNQIDLPEYTSYEKLRQQLLLAINEGGEGFGFA